MKIAEYIKSRKPDHRRKLLAHCNKLQFKISEVVFLPQTTELFLRLNQDCDNGPLKLGPTKLLRVRNVCNNWCLVHCTGEWSKLPNPTAWGFEYDSDAIMFKLTWGM